jgi:hypothetical protein
MPPFGPELTRCDIRYVVAVGGKAEVARTSGEDRFCFAAAQLSDHARQTSCNFAVRPRMRSGSLDGTTL